MSESKPTRTVLIVDDEQSLRDALEMTFSREGYQVLKAAGGCEGLEAARTLLPDVILLDVMMPGMDGYEVCKKLRSHYRTRHIPVILLTAKGTEEDKLEGLQGGANDYVLKPWNKRELVTRVHNHLEWAKNQKAVNPLTGLPGGVSVLAERIKETLEQEFPKLYEEEDRKQGFVRVRNRRHEFENFPLMSVTIALAANSEFEGLHLAQLDDALTELKTLGKGMQGSVVVSERRRRNASASPQQAAA